MAVKKANEIHDWWEDKKLIDKIVQADADMNSGKDKGMSWQDAKKKLLARCIKNPS